MPRDTHNTKAPPDEPTAAHGDRDDATIGPPARDNHDDPAIAPGTGRPQRADQLLATQPPIEPTNADDDRNDLSRAPRTGRPQRADQLLATQPPSPTALPLPAHEPSSAPTRLADGPDVAPVAPEQSRGPHRRRDPERYQILGEHGRGGLGCVSRAHDLDLDRDIAIKELISRGHSGEARFMREALVTARLEHPGIVPVYEAGRWPDGTPFYAMKLVAGRPLRDLISERTTVAERIGLLHHVIAVADAIAYAHGRNIIHRDLKPANVIVGDFGETIVIDWGLAKDLTVSEEPLLDAGPYRFHHDDGLTRTGAVLGTPTYMAPEQARGESVDQRADVFALGAMLWELCSLQKVPPTGRRLRHRLLRRAGIDADLITIVDKALATDPTRRYPDAGALAADLKAFKSGARIAARSYSLPALLAHWTRRHRALATSIVIAILLAFTGSALYVRNIAVERNRADEALDRVETTKNDLLRERAELALKNAQLLLMTDPSAAVDALKKYDGTDSIRADQLRAEALGRGVAALHAIPHSDSILWVQGAPDGAVISLSLDGTITRTLSNGESAILTSGVSNSGLFAYTPVRHLLAYSCDPANLCILDIASGMRVLESQGSQGATLIGMAFSPSGSRLALVNQAGLLSILDVTNPRKPMSRLAISVKDGNSVLFVDEDAVALGTIDGLTLIGIDGSMQNLREPEGTLWDAWPNGRVMAIATTRGEGLFIKTDQLHIAKHTTLCHGVISGLKFLPQKQIIIFSCREGDIGSWNPQTGAIVTLAHVEGHANSIEIDTSGTYVIASGDKGILVVIDLFTQLASSYRGHEFRLVATSPPTSDFPYIISADVRGGIRTWPLPSRAARVAANVHARFMSAIYDEALDVIIGGTLLPNLTTLNPTGEARLIEPHFENAPFIELAHDGSRFATYGSGDIVEIWSSAPIFRMRVLHTGHGAVSHVAFASDTNDVITSGKDGLLIRWGANDDAKTITRFEHPIVNFAIIGNLTILVGTNDGTFWHTSKDAPPSALPNLSGKVTQMQVMPDLSAVCIGFADGTAIAVDSTSWAQQSLFYARGSIRDIAISQDGHIMAIAASDDTVHIGVANANYKNRFLWTILNVRARKIKLTLHDILVVISTDGAVWKYSIPDSHWRYFSTGTVDLTHVVLREEGRTAAIFDAEGRILWVNLEAI